jgi:uncharacterized membrane protein
MVFNAGIPFSRLWIAAGIGLWVVLLFVGLGFYTPTLRDQVRVLESEGPGSEEYQRLAARGRSLGILLGIIVVVIVFLMVVKPA